MLILNDTSFFGTDYPLWQANSINVEKENKKKISKKNALENQFLVYFLALALPLPCFRPFFFAITFRSFLFSFRFKSFYQSSSVSSHSSSSHSSSSHSCMVLHLRLFR